MERLFKLADIRKLNKQVSLGEITSLRMVEIINEKAFIQMCKGIESFKDKQKAIAYEWHNEETGHAIVDYNAEYRKVLEKNGYTKMALIYK